MTRIMNLALAAIVLLVICNIGLTVWLLCQLRRAAAPALEIDPILQNMTQAQERSERLVRDEIARNRTEFSETARLSRGEDKTNFDAFCQSLISRITDGANQQKQQLAEFQIALKGLTDSNNQLLIAIRETLERKLGQMQAEATQTSATNREETAKNFVALAAGLVAQMKQMAESQNLQLQKFEAAIGTLTEKSEQKLENVRETVDGRLTAIQTDNAAKLEAMRATVDEKLHATLETRLGESFKLVSERLEQVHKGLGEMQTLASGVGDLKKVLTNIKTRGNWGEVQLGNLLEQLFTPDQYASNVAVNPDSPDRVEYAIKLPGRETDGTPMWLPIDAKFPQEDYQRLVEAAEKGDAERVATFAAALEASICLEAKKIKAKYICPPHTTDFAMLFLPTEGLFAEVLRRPGLCDGLLHQHRVVLAGPTTLAAMLSSLQMGFRTLAIEKRSSEVWQVLGAVKTEFGKFGETLDRVHKKLQEASNTIERAQTRKRAVERQLKSVETSPPEPLDVTFRAIGVPEEQMPEQKLFDSAEIP
jgi:DNA recombination protein RmuC